MAVNLSFKESIIGLEGPRVVDSICLTGVIFAAVPVKKTSSDINNSVLSTDLSITLIPIVDNTYLQNSLAPENKR